MKRITTAIILFLLVIFAGLGSWSCRGSNSGSVESVILGTWLIEPAILVFIAESRNYFARNGLKVTLKYYQSGPDLVKAVLKSEVEIASPVSEYVLVGQALKKEEIQIIGVMDKVEATFIVGRKDHGLGTVSDLKRKKVGLARGTILEFYFGRFLDLNGLSLKDVELVNVPFNGVADAIAAGNLDAVVSVTPYILAARDRLGNNAVYWAGQSNQPIYSLRIGGKKWIGQNRKLIERFLEAINQAEEYLNQHPDQAKAIAKRKLNLSDDQTNRVWAQTQFSLSLDYSLIAAMNDEAHWMINNDLTPDKTVPNFKEYVYLDGLRAIKPGLVNIVQ